jgi:hypothetical protein
LRLLCGSSDDMVLCTARQKVYEISQNYASKFEIQLIQKEVEILKLEMRDFKSNFNTQIAKMEGANDSILELITDIRLTMASRGND